MRYNVSFEPALLLQSLLRKEQSENNFCSRISLPSVSWRVGTDRWSKSGAMCSAWWLTVAGVYVYMAASSISSDSHFDMITFVSSQQAWLRSLLPCAVELINYFFLFLSLRELNEKNHFTCRRSFFVRCNVEREGCVSLERLATPGSRSQSINLGHKLISLGLPNQRLNISKRREEGILWHSLHLEEERRRIFFRH